MISKKILKHIGFTLSEVLITLVVLGIIAAVLTPAVMKITPDNNKILFKKAYYTLEKVVNSMINDEVNYPSDQIGLLSGSTTVYVSKGFNYTTATTNSTINKFCYFLVDQLNTVGTTSCPLAANQLVDSKLETRQFAITTDGIAWSIYLPVINADATPDTEFTRSTTVFLTKIILDVSGSSKGSNCTADTAALTYNLTLCGTNDKPDTFIIGVRYDGKLQVGSSDSSDSVAISILSNPTSNSK